jgi:hypothetical protein
MQPDLVVEPTGLSTPASKGGEWLPLRWTSQVVSQRFGRRARPYIVHVTKTFSVPLMREMAVMWGPELQLTSSHKFRGLKTNGGADTSLAFMFGSFVVERWREALLWSWVVANIGGEGDEWGAKEKEKAWIALGGSADATEKDMHVTLGVRDNVRVDKVGRRLKMAGEPAGRTEYVFSAFFLSFFIIAVLI